MIKEVYSTIILHIYKEKFESGFSYIDGCFNSNYKNNKKLSIFVLLLLRMHVWCTVFQFRGHIYHTSLKNCTQINWNPFGWHNFCNIFESRGINTFLPMVSNWAVWQYLETFWVVTTEWVLPTSSGQGLAMHRAASMTKNYLVQNVNSTEVEKYPVYTIFLSVL